MQPEISRSEKKRQAARVEELARELAELSANEQQALPADTELQQALKAARNLKAGARKRQIKFIAGLLRQRDHQPLATFLARRKGSRLQETAIFHELENLRQAIISEAISALEEARHLDLPLADDWESPTLDAAGQRFPSLDSATIRQAAGRYARNRKPTHAREIFRQLQSAHDRQQRSGQP